MMLVKKETNLCNIIFIMINQIFFFLSNGWSSKVYKWLQLCECNYLLVYLMSQFSNLKIIFVGFRFGTQKGLWNKNRFSHNRSSSVTLYPVMILNNCWHSANYRHFMWCTFSTIWFFYSVLIRQNNYHIMTFLINNNNFDHIIFILNISFFRNIC